MKNNIFDERIVKYGKSKATAIYIALGLSALIVITVIHSLFVYKNIFGSFTHNVGFLFFAAAIIVINSLRSYDDAVAQLKKAEELKRKGLTQQDVNNISFVNSWQERKQNGYYKYVLFNGGIIAGSIIFIAISLAFFPKAIAGGRQFPEFNDMINYMVKCWGVGFTAGVLLCSIIWYRNEQRFKRLISGGIKELLNN